MHLLYLQQLLVMPGSAGNVRTWEMARHFVRAGHKITFITSNALFPQDHSFFESQSFPHYFEYEQIGIWVVDVPYSHFMSFPKRLISFISFYFKAIRIGKKIKDADAVLAYSAPLSVGEIGRKLAAYHQIPLFFEIGDVWPDVPIGMGIIRNRLLIRWLYFRTKKIYKRAKLIFPFSEGMKAQIVRHGIEPDKIHITYNCVNIEEIPYVERRSRKGSVELIYIGTIGIANGLDQLIRAAHQIEQMGREDIIWTIVGDGNDGARIRKLAKELKLKSVSFYSSIARKQVPEMLNKADIGVVSFAPYPVLEANGAAKFFDYLASGLPVVINYKGWQAELLNKFQCGLSARQGDEVEFANHILTLADDERLRSKMGLKGREMTELLFTRTKAAEKMLKLMSAHLRQDRLS